MFSRTASLDRRPAAQSAVRDAGLAIAGSAFVALAAQVAILLPFSPVPVTGQTLAVLVVGALLGSRLGAAALLAYLAEGMIGLPVFAPGAALGIARLVSPTGGYLIGFILAAWIVGRIIETGADRRVSTTALALVLGTLGIYACGVAGLAVYMPLDRAVPLGVVPFLPGDLLKVVLAVPLVAFRRR